MDAFDADVLIYAAAREHPAGRAVRSLLSAEAEGPSGAPPRGVGSVLLLPELLSKPLRDGRHSEVEALSTVLGRLELLPVDLATATLASALGATYGLRAADAVHLATAVNAGAVRFITNNRKDFPVTIAEIQVTYPEDLPTR